ncbi:hypothetical protein CEP54_003638 [Fusarium duplospermum]|uniref:G domain-containing protein n=1 Tax=Fusarium duplospermum TaxID=1325734 RepID=A0A428QMV8_9HYPO|nr:hypothetical protein CEP54_003638 [Fusarium duplospermum]
MATVAPQRITEPQVHFNQDEATEDFSLIAVMGVTGSGKSNFLQHLVKNVQGGGPVVGHNLDSCTQKTEKYECRLGNKQIVFFDTPGFDDTYRGDADVLADIAQVLSSSYKNDLKLNGIIYLHRIKDERMTNAIMRNLTLFRNLCGDAAFRNVILVTTFWDELQDQEKGEGREQQLLGRSEWWGYMAAKGSRTMRFRNTQESALEIVSEIVDLDTVTLQVQKEMVNEGREVDQTTAGEALNSELVKLRMQYEKELEAYRHEMDQAKQEHDDQLHQTLETMEQEKLALLRDIESEQAALHADRREERRRMEQEFSDEKLRQERESARIKEEQRRMQEAIDEQFNELREKQKREMQEMMDELEQRLTAEREEGQARLREALESSNRVIKELESKKNHQAKIESIKEDQREVTEEGDRWASDMRRINHQILDTRLKQQLADQREREGLQATIDKLEEQKAERTRSFWSRVGALASVGSMILAAIG